MPISITQQRVAVQAVADAGRVEGQLTQEGLEAAVKTLLLLEKHDAVFRTVAEIMMICPDAKLAVRKKK